VDPILDQVCRECHTDGGEAVSIALETPADLDARLSTVVHELFECTMPPSGSGVTLTDADREVLLGWAVCRANR
jgi:hypothetical protein